MKKIKLILFVLIFIITLAINGIIEFIGEENIAKIIGITKIELFSKEV